LQKWKLIEGLLLLNLPTLVNRRTMLGTIFMQHFIRGDIDSVELVSRLTFNVPVRLKRNYYPLNLPRCTSNFCLHEPFRVQCNSYKNLYHLICTSIPVLKTIILTHLLYSSCVFYFHLCPVPICFFVSSPRTRIFCPNL